MKPYIPVVEKLLNSLKPSTILDAPSGGGWLPPLLKYEAQVDGIDLFENKPEGYASFVQADLDSGIPGELGTYEAVVTCEGIEHVGNPLLLLESMNKHLVKNGAIIITTPNVWYPGAKLQYFLRGFFPSFPCLVGKIKRGTHMHIMPWSFPHLYLYLKLAGFKEIKLHDVDEPKPKHIHEYFFGWPQKMYCNHRKKKAEQEEEIQFWTDSGSNQSLYGRRLVVSASKA